MNQLAKISINNLSTDCVLGVEEQERRAKQTVLISVDFVVDVTKSSMSDAIIDTVNYSILSKKIIYSVSQSQFHLLETLASMVLRTCLEDKRVIQAVVRVTKPSRGVTIEIIGKQHA